MHGRNTKMNLNDTASTGNTSYLARPGGRVGYDVSGTGPRVFSCARPWAFALTTRTSHAAAEARLAEVTAPVLVVMGEQDPDFPDPAGMAGWIAQTMRAAPGAIHNDRKS